MDPLVPLCIRILTTPMDSDMTSAFVGTAGVGHVDVAHIGHPGGPRRLGELGLVEGVKTARAMRVHRILEEALGLQVQRQLLGGVVAALDQERRRVFVAVSRHLS